MQQMLESIESEYSITRRMTGIKSLDPRIKQAILDTPRDKFVPKAYLGNAYNNRPLPIGHGQTISQPYIVALMTDLLQLDEDGSVLEIGTGSGYQAAILSKLCRQVYTIEYVATLAEMARARFEKLGYRNIECRAGNGYYGWPEYAPFDGTIVTAAATHIPPALIEQLKPGSRMVIPVGQQYGRQVLKRVTKNNDDSVEVDDILDVAFVPFQGERDEQ